MKKFILRIAIGLAACSSLGFVTSSFGQANIIEKNTIARLELFTPLQVALVEKGTHKEIKLYTDVLENVTGFEINKDALKEINAIKPQTLQFIIPTSEGNLEVMLHQYDFFTADFNAWVNDGKGNNKINYKKGVYYRGYVNGISPSLVTFSFFENEFVGIISTNNKGNYNIISRPDLGYGAEHYIVFNDTDIKNISSHIGVCATSDTDVPVLNTDNNIIPPPSNSSQGNCRTITVSMHADYRAFVRNGEDTTRTINYLTTLMNANATLYANDDIKIALKNTYVNTVQDNYPSNTSSAILQKFGNDVNRNITADLHQLITKTSRGNLGGVAWLDKLCNTPIQYGGNWYGPYSITDNSALVSQIASIPVYSWDVSASSHEMGHNLGSNHTHWCGWPGGAIDGCVAVEADDRNQSCTRPPAPTNGGTIMSYCHLLNGVGVNFNNGFGPLPKALINDKIGKANCISSLEPENIINTPNTTITSNTYCENGNWITFYNDNATSDPDDDIMIIAIKKEDVPNIDLNQSTFSMTTTNTYATGNIINVQSGYKPYNEWTEGNRQWNLNIVPAPQGKVGFKVPFLTNDFVEVYRQNNTSLNTLQILTIINNDISTLTPNGVQVLQYRKDLNAGQWWTSLSSTETIYGSFIWAEGNASNNIYGIRLGYGKGGLSINDATNIGINIFPNPTDDKLNIQIPTHVNIDNIKIIDILGREVYTQDVSTFNNNIILNTANWSKGVYSIILDSKDKQYIHKIVKN